MFSEDAATERGAFEGTLADFFATAAAKYDLERDPNVVFGADHLAGVPDSSRASLLVEQLLLFGVGMIRHWGKILETVAKTLPAIDLTLGATDQHLEGPSQRRGSLAPEFRENLRSITALSSHEIRRTLALLERTTEQISPPPKDEIGGYWRRWAIKS